MRASRENSSPRINYPKHHLFQYMEEGARPTLEERLEHFQRMLRESNPASRWKAAEGLARMEHPGAVPVLIEALSDEDWRVRQKVAWALGILGDPSALPHLRRALGNEKEDVREMIVEAISLIEKRSGREI